MAKKLSKRSKPPAADPPPIARPAELADDPAAAAEWDRLTRELDQAGRLDPARRSALTLFCRTWSRWLQAENDLAASGGSILTTKNGNVIQNPFVAIANKAADRLVRLFPQLDITRPGRIPAAPSIDGTKQPEADPDDAGDNLVVGLGSLRLIGTDAKRKRA